MRLQEQYNISRLPTRVLDVKFDILNERDVVIDSLIGKVTSGNISIDAQSSHRRSGSITLVFNEDRLYPSPSSPIWFNNRCDIQVGIDDLNGETVWFKMGRFVFSDLTLNEELSHTTMSCSLGDYMAFLDGTLGGHQSHKTLIKGGEATIREAILATVYDSDKGFVANVASDEYLNRELPFDIEHSPNSTAYSILSELVDIYAGYEMFFDKDGVFVVQRVADKKYDIPVEYFGKNADIDFTISPSERINFGHVKNTIYVWGYTNEEGEQFQARMCNKYYTRSLRELKQKKAIEGDIGYVDGEGFYLYADDEWTLRTTSLNPTYCVDDIGEKILSVEDSDILSTEQAQLRALYELEQYSNLDNTINIQLLPLYYLDVNEKIQVDYGVVNGEFLIQSISVDLDVGGKMNISAKKLF